MKIIYSFFVCLSLLSCKKKQTTYTVAIPETLQTKKTVSKTTAVDSLEQQIYKSIDLVKKADNSNRKSRMFDLISYAQEVDGKASDVYFNFMYNYPVDYPEQFFSVFTAEDKSFITSWAECASGEFLIMYKNKNSKALEPIFADIYNRLHPESDGDSLKKYYVDQLRESVNSVLNGTE